VHDVTDRPEIVCLCGSAQHADRIDAVARRLALEGVVVLAPTRFPEPPTPRQRTALGELHLRRIELADRVVVVSPDGRLGQSTSREIAHARAAGKPVTLVDGG